VKVFFVGDFFSNTGPAIANKALLKGLKYENIIFSKAKNKLTRVLELLYKTLFSDCICFCSYSKLNFLGLKIARIFNKKTFYIMHGYKTYEYKINKNFISAEEIKRINYEEKKLIKSVDKVFCVSKRFMEFMKKAEPDCKNKFDYNFNPVELEKIKNIINNKSKKNNQIVSIGGGMKQKNNLNVCKAIDKLNKEKKLDLKYVVIGLPYTDKNKILSYDFVTYYDTVSHEKVLEILSESYLYIQNSIFETFGLSVIEALACNCNLLISDKVGALDIFETITSEDIIYDANNIDEISKKIEKILLKGNFYRLQKGLRWNEIDYRISAKNLLRKINNYMYNE